MDRILIVDDEVDLVTTYERLLRRKGYHVVSAGSCRDGIRLIEREPLALVVTDLRLPDGDGLEIVRAARRTPTPTPALVVTGFASASNRTAAMAAGASACLAKPFAASSLTTLVEQTLSGR
ncbi:MAG: response regulator [Candidatus Rokuibacteriota bacterium]